MAKALRDIRSHPHPRCCLAVPRTLNAFFFSLLTGREQPEPSETPRQEPTPRFPKGYVPPPDALPTANHWSWGAEGVVSDPQELLGHWIPLTMWLGEGNYAWGEEIAAVGTMIVRLARTCSSSLGGESTLSVCVCGADAEHAVSEIPRWLRRLLQLGDTLKEISWW